MIRYAMEQLIEWENRSNRKPLVLKGARQVGKVDSLELHPMSFTEFPEAVCDAFKRA